MIAKTLKPKHKFYTSAAYSLARKATREDIYEMSKDFDITRDQVDEYFKNLTMSKAVSGALMAGREEKEALYNALDQKFIEHYPTIIIFKRGEGFDFYEYKNGVYLKIFDRDMYDYVDTIMSQYSLFEYRASSRQVKDTVQRVASLLSRTSGKNFCEDDLSNRKWLLNLKNGLLDMNTLTLSSHTPLYFSTTQAPFDYNPEAICPEFDKFVNTISNQSESTVKMIQEMFGYCLKEGNAKHKVFYLYGDTARNGKSTAAKIICGLIGWGNVSTLSLAQIAGENSAILTSIVGKQINFSDEISSKYIESSRLTAMSAEGIVEINPKFKPSYLYPVKTKFIIACNDLPRFKDSQGMKHRMISIPFRYHFTEEDRIERYDEILLGKEGSGILNWAIKGMNIKVFSINEESKEDIYDNLLQSNSIYAYMDMNFDFGEINTKEFTSEILYGNPKDKDCAATGFREFCELKGIKEASYFTFCRELKRFERETNKIKQIRKGEDRTRCYVGLKHKYLIDNVSDM